ncbi:MAG: sigma-54-dependent transcriptional regulator [Desulfococcaceae bacterium]
MFPTILIIDDETSILQSLSGLLIDEGFEVLTASNGYEGLKMIEEEAPDIVLLDIWMPGIDGIETLKEIKKGNPSLQVIIITGHGNVETAVRATKLGAFDLIEKPLSIDKVIVDINKALNFRRLEEENRYLRKKTIEKHSISGNSPVIAELKKQIAVIAPTDSWILITGENGTGKELAARTIHLLSPRAEEPFIDINCAAVPEDRLESELFGHEKGAFSGAEKRLKGGLEIAHEGTLFLDEICDMNLSTQARLLRVLQEQKFQRTGGGRTLRVNVRIIAATNKDPEKEIREGRLREDLYYRLNEIPITVPPLRNRKEDIPLLVQTLLDEKARKNSLPPKKMSPEALEMLCAYSWPGNVRELKNLMGRLVLMSENNLIQLSDIPAPYSPKQQSENRTEESFFATDSMADALSHFETAFIRRKYLQYGRDIHRTASAIGLHPDSLYREIADMGDFH